MDVTVTLGASSEIDLPAWLQATAALVALGVTVFQWWSARGDARREKRARQMAGYAVLNTAHAALSVQSERLAQTRLTTDEDAMGRYAAAILDAGFDIIERSVYGVDLSGLNSAGVEAVMHAHSAVNGIKLSLRGMADVANGEPVWDEQAEAIKHGMMQGSVAMLIDSLDRLKRSADDLRRAIETG